MTNLTTDPKLIEALRAASQRSLTYEELRKQRVSFIMASIDDSSGVTREKVEEILDRYEGRKVS
jgi:hypothetical protein